MVTIVAKTAEKPAETGEDKVEQSAAEISGAATKAYNEALANLDAAKAALTSAGASGDIDAMVEAAGKVRACEAQVVKTAKAVKDAEFNRNSEARLAASVELKATVGTFVDGFDLPTIYAIGLRGFSVTFNEDGSANVNVQGMQAPSAAGRVRKDAPTGGEGKVPRALYMLNGRGYTSRELLETFGGEKGRIAIARTRPASEEPEYGWDKNKLTANGKPQSNPGFDSEAKALAKRMGWDGNEPRILTREPEGE